MCISAICRTLSLNENEMEQINSLLPVILALFMKPEGRLHKQVIMGVTLDMSMASFLFKARIKNPGIMTLAGQRTMWGLQLLRTIHGWQLSCRLHQIPTSWKWNLLHLWSPGF
jgi:hypothetical protein